MRTKEKIIDEYRGGSFEKRLSLFLECPSLRTEFIEIDQSESPTENRERISRCKSTAICSALFSRLIRI
jgi:hypothetical protein